MKKIIILASFILMACSSKCIDDELTCLQIVDRNGMSETISSKEKLKNFSNVDFQKPQSYQRVLRIYQNREKGQIVSKLTTYYPNGQLHKSLEIINSRAYGKYIEKHPNGNLKIEANVIGGPADFNAQDEWIFEGPSKVFDEKGTLISEFYYEKGMLQKEAKYYHPKNSKLKKVIPYLDNEIDGMVLEYDINEQLISKASFKKGINHGTATAFWGKDNIRYIEEYEEGKIISGQYFQKSRVRICKIKNGDGQKAIFKDGLLHQLVEYKNGKPEGKIEVFSKDFELVNEYYQKDQVKDGEEIEYYTKKQRADPSKNKTLLPKLLITWDNGLIQGNVKTWYKNGKLESQKEYLQNKKNGPHFAWYENGSVMFIEEYENDSLIKGSYFQMSQKEPASTIVNGCGIATLFDSKGRFIKKINYKNGNPLNE
ncbi:MAG: hypothetical protein JXA94_05965 [Parachlamydiales bacterium]|nr:hypothetical protein [Parachlamydiales bacterium]